MKYILAILAFAILAAPSQAQPLKALMYGTNGQVVANTGTNVLMFTNDVKFSSGDIVIGVSSIYWAGSGAGLNLEEARFVIDDANAQWTFGNPVTFGDLTIAQNAISAQQLTINFEDGAVEGAMHIEDGISFTPNGGATTRTNLGLGATWLTNTDVTNFRTAIGLGVASDPTFNSIKLRSSYSFNATVKTKFDSGVNGIEFGTETTNGAGYQEIATFMYGGSRSGLRLDGFNQAIWFNGGQAQTRTNLGLGATNEVSFGKISVSDSIVLPTIGGRPVTNYSSMPLQFGVANGYGGLYANYWGEYGIKIMMGGTSNTLSEVAEFSTGDIEFRRQVKFDTDIVAATRTNLGLGATWLTNTSSDPFKTAIGLGVSDFVYFAEVGVGRTIDTYTMGGTASITNLNSGFSFKQSGTPFLTISNLTGANGGALIFHGTAGAATTRTNLGLGATWLTNSTAPLFWASVPTSPTNSGTAGQVAYTNNFLYICISNNTWRRVQLGTW